MPRWRKGKRGYARFYDKKTGERLYPGEIILNDNGTYRWIRANEVWELIRIANSDPWIKKMRDER